MDGERILAAALAWLATFAVHGVVLCAAAWALGAVLARLVHERAMLAAARERLWKLAIFGGVVTATLTAAGGGPSRLRIEIAPEPPAAEIESSLALPSSEPSRGSVSELPQRAIPGDWTSLAGAIWFAGIALGGAAWLRDRRRLARCLSGRTRADTGVAHELLEGLRRRSNARRSPVLWRAPGLSSPITLGILQPAICIPPCAETELMREELEALLAHELAHVERRDALVLTLCRAVEVLCFVQPLLRFARARFVEEAEILCDERAAAWTGDPAALASCLAEVATWVVAGRRGDFAPAMAAHGSRLALRVRGLLDEPRGAREDRARRGLASRALVIGLVPLALFPIPLALGGISLDTDRPASAPEERADEDLAGSARELRALLSTLESEFAAIAADPRLPSAPARSRERAAAIQTRLLSLRAASARLDSLLAEGSSRER